MLTTAGAESNRMPSNSINICLCVSFLGRISVLLLTLFERKQTSKGDLPLWEKALTF